MMLNVWLFFATLLCVECSLTAPCGPNDACLCTAMPGEYNATTMDCVGKGLNISDICKSVGSTPEMAVRQLDASFNKIRAILGSSEMNGCDSLYVLNLQNNALKWIGKDALEGLKDLKVLNLSMNNLEVYKADGLYNITKLKALETLRLNGNINQRDEYVNLSYPSLEILPNLKTLYLDGLTNTAFDISYENITNLTLSGYISTCHLGNLTSVTFQHVHNVRQLNLSKCIIQNIDAETFTKLTFLEILDLSYNQRLGLRSLRNVSYGLQFTNIKFFNYSNVYNTYVLGNVVRKKDLCYLRNTSITELVLEGNSIQLFETNSPMLLPKMLEVLRLDDNKFMFALYLLQGGCAQHVKQAYVSYQNRFHGLKYYRSEDNTNIAEPAVDDDGDHDECPFMKDEYLKNISRETPLCPFFSTNNVPFLIPTIPAETKKVVLRGGSFQFILRPVRFVPDNNVEYFDASGNIFSSWIGPIGPFPKLKYLDLSRNYCSYVSKQFFSMYTALEDLQISENFIGLILASKGEIFDTLWSLRTLNLTSNRITALERSTFNKLFNLETLDLSANSLDNLNIAIDALVNLTNLNVSSNALPTLPMSLVEHLVKVSERRNVPFTISMLNNSIKVSCQYETFLNWMINHKSNFVDFEYYTFLNENNDHIHPSRIQEYVESLSKSCKSYTVLIVICSIGFSVFLAVVIGGVIYKNRWKLRYMLYMAKGRYDGYMAIPDREPQFNYRYDAFISYSSDNLRFILDGVIPKLEEHNFELCIHQRDFMAGNAVADNIMDAIIKSKTTVVILTAAYLRSKWCMYEFNMARMESVFTRNNENSLLFIMKENVPTKDMPLEMMKWIKDNSYLEYNDDPEGELLFWNNLRDALKH